MGTDAVRSEVWGNRTKTAHDLRAYEPMLDLAADWLRAMAEATRLENEVTPLPELLGERTKAWTVGAVPTSEILEDDTKPYPLAARVCARCGGSSCDIGVHCNHSDPTEEIDVDLGDETFQDGGK